MKYATIYFPTFGLEMNPGYKLDVGPFSFYYYGIIIALGIVLAVIYGLRRAQQFGLKQDDILDGVLFIVPLSIICARIYYCIFSWEEYAANPIEVLYIWNGGLAIYGGVIGAALCIVAYCKIKKISLGAVLDVVSLGFLIGQSIGRWGNFFNREAFGVPTDFFLRMGLEDTRTGTMTFYHPTFLYESLWNAVGFVLLHILSKRRKYDGQIALGYMAWYGLGRTFIEGLRTDSLYWGDFRVSQVLAAVSCVTAVVILVLQAFKQHDPAKLFANIRAGEFALPEEAEVAAEETAEEAEEATEETEDVAEGTEEAAEEAEEIEEAIEEPATEAEAVSEEPAQEN